MPPTKKPEPTRSFAVAIGVFAVIAAAVTHALHGPAIVTLWAGALCAAFAEKPPIMSGSKDNTGRIQPANPSEEASRRRYSIMRELRFALLVPTRGIIPGWPIYLSWIFAVALAFAAAGLATTVPLGGALNAWCAFVLVTQGARVRREMNTAPKPHPGARLSAFGPWLRSGIAPKIWSGAALVVSVVAGAIATDPRIIADPLDAWFGVFPGWGDRWYPWLSAPAPTSVVSMSFALWCAAVSVPLSRFALTEWDELNDAHAARAPMWQLLKADPAPVLRSVRRVGPATIEEFSGSGMFKTQWALAQQQKIAEHSGAGATVVVCVVPSVDAMGQPQPGTMHPDVFEIVTWPDGVDVDVCDPESDPDVVEVRARVALAVSCVGYGYPLVASLEDISVQPPVEPARLSWMAKLKGHAKSALSWVALRGALLSAWRGLVSLPQVAQKARRRLVSRNADDMDSVEADGFLEADGEFPEPPPIPEPRLRRATDVDREESGDSEAEFSPTRAWMLRVDFAGYGPMYAALREGGIAGSLAGMLQADVVVDHRTDGGMILFGAIEPDAPTIFSNPAVREKLHHARGEDGWIVRWTDILKMGQQKPTYQGATERTDTVVIRGRTIELHSVSFLVKQGVDPRDYFDLEPKIATTLNQASLASVTGYPRDGVVGLRHPGAFTVTWSNDPMEDNIRMLPADQEYRRGVTSILAAKVNRAFRAARLARPELAAARPLVPLRRDGRGEQLRRPHGAARPAPGRQRRGQIWQMDVRLQSEDGTTFADVKGALSRIAQSLGDANLWVRVAPYEHGVRLFAGDQPSSCDLGRDEETLCTKLDWDAAFIASGVTGLNGRVPTLTSAKRLEKNEKVQQLTFDLPDGVSAGDIGASKNLEKLKSATSNSFIQLLPGDRASEAMLLAAETDPLPLRVDTDFAAFDEGGAIPFATGMYGDPVVFDRLKDPHLLIMGGSGTGKAQPLDEVVWCAPSARFPDGRATIGQLRVGDVVFGPDGLPAPVCDFSAVRDEEVWRVTAADGAHTRCSSDHLWVVDVDVAVSCPESRLVKLIAGRCASDDVAAMSRFASAWAARHHAIVRGSLDDAARVCSNIVNADELRIVMGDIAAVTASRMFDVREAVLFIARLCDAARGWALGERVRVPVARSTQRLSALMQACGSDGHAWLERVVFDDGVVTRKRVPLAGVSREDVVVPMRCILVNSPDHMYVTGGGLATHNTVSCQNLIYGMLVNNWDVVAIDPTKGIGDLEFAKSRMKVVVDGEKDFAGALAAMRWAYAEFERRKALYLSHGLGNIYGLPDDVRPPLMCVFIDEFNSLILQPEKPPSKPFDDPELETQRLEQIAEYRYRSAIGGFAAKFALEARSGGISLVLAGQKLVSDDLKRIPGGRAMRSSMARVLIGKTNMGDQSAGLMNPESVPKYDPSEFPKGRAIWESTEGRPTYVQGWFAEQDVYIRELIARVPDEAVQADISPFMPDDPAAGAVAGQIISTSDDEALPELESVTIDGVRVALEALTDDGGEDTDGGDEVDWASWGDDDTDGGDVDAGDAGLIVDSLPVFDGAADDDPFAESATVAEPPASDESFNDAFDGPSVDDEPPVSEESLDDPFAESDADADDALVREPNVDNEPGREPMNDDTDTSPFDVHDADETADVPLAPGRTEAILSVTDGPAGAIRIGGVSTFEYMYADATSGWWVADAVLAALVHSTDGYVSADLAMLDKPCGADGRTHRDVLRDALSGVGVRMRADDDKARQEDGMFA